MCIFSGAIPRTATWLGRHFLPPAVPAHRGGRRGAGWPSTPGKWTRWDLELVRRVSWWYQGALAAKRPGCGLPGAAAQGQPGGDRGAGGGRAGGGAPPDDRPGRGDSIPCSPTGLTSCRSPGTSGQGLRRPGARGRGRLILRQGDPVDAETSRLRPLPATCRAPEDTEAFFSTLPGWASPGAGRAPACPPRHQRPDQVGAVRSGRCRRR